MNLWKVENASNFLFISKHTQIAATQPFDSVARCNLNYTNFNNQEVQKGQFRIERGSQ